jgi:hypothetical protein
MDEFEGLGLHSPCGRLVTTSVVGLRRQHCLVATALLDECEGLRSLCGRLMLCLGKCGPLSFFCGEGVLVAPCLGECGPPACFLGLSVLRGSLIGDGLCSLGSRRSMLLLSLQCTCTAFLLVLHAGKCGLMLQSPQGLASEPGKEAMAAEPQEDDSTSSFFVKEALSTCSLHLTFVVGALVKKVLSCASGFLAGGLLLSRHEVWRVSRAKRRR